MIPESLRVQRVPDKSFNEYRDTLGGFTTQNEAQVRQKLQDIGIIPGAGVLGQHDDDAMQWARDKRTREEAQSSHVPAGTAAPMQGVQPPQGSTGVQTGMVQDICASLQQVT